MIRLLIADDHQVLLDGFISLFENINDILVVGTARNGQEVLDFLSENQADVILLDINMPVLNGVETCKQIVKKFPSVSVIALSMYTQHSYFKRMIQYGAKGYLLKNDAVEDIEKAIRIVVNGGHYVSSQLQSMFISLKPVSGSGGSGFSHDTSPRELEVLQLVSEGYTDQQIADQLFISIHTVNSHRKNLLSKFDARNTAELVKKAMERGII